MTAPTFGGDDLRANVHAHSRARRLVVFALLYLRGRIRASELWLVVIAAGVGAVAGLATLTTSFFGAALSDRTLRTIAHGETFVRTQLKSLDPFGPARRRFAAGRPDPAVDEAQAAPDR